MAEIGISDKDTARFWSKVEFASDCWMWTAYRGDDGFGKNKGYGRYSYSYTQSLAHRFVWVTINGPIPKGLCVLHHCDNPGCVNPEHLFLGTHTDNMADMIAKGRKKTCNGERHLYAKLTEAGILDMRRRYAKGDIAQRELAVEYGVVQSAISMAINGVNWKRVTP